MTDAEAEQFFVYVKFGIKDDARFEDLMKKYALVRNYETSMESPSKVLRIQPAIQGVDMFVLRGERESYYFSEQNTEVVHKRTLLDYLKSYNSSMTEYNERVHELLAPQIAHLKSFLKTADEINFIEIFLKKMFTHQ